MVYYNYEMAKRMKEIRFDDALQKYFPENDKWGANVLFDEHGHLEIVEICTLINATINGATWSHCANIIRFDNGKWEVNSQFNGENENEMWIYGYYEYFGGACRCITGNNFKNRMPIKKYL